MARSYIAPDVTTRVSAVLAAKCLEFYASLMFRKQIPGTEECRIYIEGVVVKKPLTIYGALHSTLFDRRLKVSGWRRAPGSERQGQEGGEGTRRRVEAGTRSFKTIRERLELRHVIVVSVRVPFRSSRSTARLCPVESMSSHKFSCHQLSTSPDFAKLILN